MPPDCRNHRDATAGATRHAAAASSVDKPVAIADQKLRSISRRQPGRPGDRRIGRPVIDVLQPFGRPTRTSQEVLRRPVEPKPYGSLRFGRNLRASGVVGSMGRSGTPADNAVAESFFATLQTELLDRSDWPTRDGLRTAIF